MYSVQCTVYNVQCTVLSVHYTVHLSTSHANPTSVQRHEFLDKNQDKSLKSFPPCYSQSPVYSFALRFLFLRNHATSYSFYRKKGENLKKTNPLPYGLRNTYRNLKSENSQDYAQRPQRTCKFMNSASVRNSYFSVAVIDTRTDRTAMLED
jgi:hypothetical protein